MSVLGSFNVEFATPMGKQKGVIKYADEGGTLTGSLTLLGTENPIDAGGTITGNDIAHTAKLKSPMGMMAAKVKAKIDGDNIEGTVSVPMGNLNFTGTRAA